VRLLDISYNEFGDRGLGSLTSTLVNHSVNQLHINGCGISYNGAELLANNLIPKCNISTFHIYENPITVEGARAVLKAALSNETCLIVKLDKEYKSGDDEIEQIINTLKDRNQAKVCILQMHASTNLNKVSLKRSNLKMK